MKDSIRGFYTTKKGSGGMKFPAARVSSRPRFFVRRLLARAAGQHMIELHPVVTAVPRFLGSISLSKEH